MAEKEYGKLSESQFQRLIRQLPEFQRESKEMGAAFRAASDEKLREILGDGVWWAPVYELSLVEGIALLIYALGKADRFNEMSRLPDPQDALLREMENDKDDIWGEFPECTLPMQDIVGLVTALQRNVFSIMLYKESICSLIAKARENADDEALFNAIRVDRSIISCPTAAIRISKAELLGEKRFFIRLKSALKGPLKKHWDSYRDLRYSLAVLRELGFDRLSDEQLHHLLVKVLKVYPDVPTARKNLRQQYHLSRKIKTL